MATLSEKHRELARLLIKGYTIKDASWMLRIAYATGTVRVEEIKERLGVNNMAEMGYTLALGGFE